MEERFKKRRTSEDLGINNLIRNEDSFFVHLTQDRATWSDTPFSVGKFPLSPEGIHSSDPSRGRKRSMSESFNDHGTFDTNGAY